MINDLKDFEKFLKICRKQGVSDVSVNGISVKINPIPVKSDNDSDEIETDGLSPEELAFYHLQNVGGNQ